MPLPLSSQSSYLNSTPKLITSRISINRTLVPSLNDAAHLFVFFLICGHFLLSVESILVIAKTI